MDRRVEIEHIQRIRREITTERAKVNFKIIPPKKKELTLSSQLIL